MPPPNVATKSVNLESVILRLSALISALLVVFGAIYSFIKIVTNETNHFHAEHLRVYLVFFNFIVLVAFCFFSTRVPAIAFIDDTESLKKKFSDTFSVRATFSNNRVNILVRQLHNHILLYAFFLILVYLLYLVEKVYSIHHPGDQSYISYFKIGQDVFNFFSSVFVYLGFKVLYNQTLDERNKPIVYYLDAVFFILLYLTVYILVVAGGLQFSIDAKNHLINLFGLVSGVFNGLAMALLFGRFVSMEHVLMNMQKVNTNSMLALGALFILPTYAIVQPLFGSFKIDAFGDPEMFANFVFFVCLIGKGFFLFLYTYYLRRKYLHLYLHLIISRRGLSRELAGFFKLKD